MPGGWGAGAGVGRGAASRLSEGVQSGLLRAGAPPDAVDYLQGHVIAGSRGRYATRCAAADGGV